MNIKTTIIYDFTSNKTVYSDIQIVNVKYSKNLTTFNTTEYELAHNQPFYDCLVPCKVGVFTLDENNNIICGGMLFTPAEKTRNNTILLQVFTAMKILENTPWIGGNKITFTNRDFLYYARILRNEITQHNKTLSDTLTATINTQRDNPHCSFTEKEDIQRGVTLNILDEWNELFHVANLTYEDGWTVSSDRIVPKVVFKNREKMRVRSEMLLDVNVNIVDYENEYKGEYANAVMVVGAEKETDNTHTNANITLPPFHATYKNNNTNIVKWLIVNDERLKSNNSCYARAVKEYKQAVTRLDINSITVKNHAFANIYDIELLDVLKINIDNTLKRVRVDAVEFDYASDLVKLETKLLEQ